MSHPNATPYHVKYFAHGLTRRGSSGLDRLSMSLFDASVDLNPHQIEAALFALQSPLSMVLAAEKALRDTKERIKTLTREARQAATLDAQHAIQEEIAKLEKVKRKQRQDIFKAEDEIIEKRDSLVN